MTTTERALITVLLAAMAILAIVVLMAPAPRACPDYSACELMRDPQGVYYYECPAGG